MSTGEKHVSGRVGVFIVSFNAVQHLEKTLLRIPPEVYQQVEEIYVFDDCSKDETFQVGVGFKYQRGLEKLRVYKNTRNLRYGGNQKRGYLYALDHGFDVVVLLHGDGQYAPECLWQLIAPLLANEADMVFGSRMHGGALKGGMPLYKFLGNRVLTWIQNRIAGSNLTEFHSGYRAFRCDALRKVPFLVDSDEWHFDTQIILQFLHAGLRIKEVPIPTFYGNEICHVNGIAYAANCVRTTLGYRLHKLGLLYERKFRLTTDSLPKPPATHPCSAYANILEQLSKRPPLRILELGCGEGLLSAQLQRAGHTVVGIEKEDQAADKAAARGVQVIRADLETFDFRTLDQPFDLVIAVDILEHLRNPDEVLMRAVKALQSDGSVILDVPNVANIVVRLLLLMGYFPYGGQGILDRTHVNFFTMRSALEMVRQSGLKVQDVTVTPLPLPRVFPRFSKTWIGRIAYRALISLTRVFRTLFGYQFLIEGNKVGYREDREAVEELRISTPHVLERKGEAR
jgi:glycosyltransferase involved in cell wall biosynthesis